MKSLNYLLLALFITLYTSVNAYAIQSDEDIPLRLVDYSNNVNSLKSSLERITKVTNEIESTDRSNINSRYDKSKEALSVMGNALANSKQVLDSLYLAEILNKSTNIWTDQDFRNWADKYTNWFSTVGLAFAAIMPAVDKKHDIQWITVGIGSAALGKLTGILFGQQTGEKFEEKMAYVEYTRKAYDDLIYRMRMIKEYSDEHTRLIKNIDNYLNDSKFNDKKKPTDQEKIDVIVGGSVYLPLYDLAMTRIPAALEMYEKTINEYCNGAVLEAHKAVNEAKKEKSDANPSFVKLNAMECIAKSQTSNFKLTGEARSAMLQAAQHIAVMMDEKDRANQIRTLSPILRQAFLAPIIAK